MAGTPQHPFALLDLDTLLSDEEKAIRDVVRDYVDERIKPDVADWFESGQIPARELARELGELGLLGMHLEGYGCAGTSATAYGLACLELEAGDSGIRSLVSVQGSLAMYAIHAFGSEEQKRGVAAPAWPPARRSAASASPSPTSAPTRPACARAAKRDGDDWVLDGTKMWITNGTIADVAVVWARTDDGIRGFVVPTDTPGFTRARDPQEAVAARVGRPRELVLEDVRLPADAVLPGREGPARPAVVPQRGALRHRLRHARRRARLPRDRDRLLDRPRAVRPADRRLPAHPEEARRHGARARQGLPARAAPRPAQGRAHDPARAGQRRQAQQRPRVARDRPRVPLDPRRRTASPSSTR